MTDVRPPRYTPYDPLIQNSFCLRVQTWSKATEKSKEMIIPKVKRVVTSSRERWVVMTEALAVFSFVT